MPYQTFDDQAGDSRSPDKLKKLHFPANMRGMSFLDIGCNEGYFCIEAVRRGASRVIGIDSNPEVLERARLRAHGMPITYLQQSWQQLPNERFDIVLMASSLHYEPSPKLLVREICKRLKNTGLFILEAGAYTQSMQRIFVEVQRHDGTLSYPTLRSLQEDILESMSVRHVGKSVQQSGDPLERHVFHCRAKRPVAIIFAGDSGSGKTYISTVLSKRSNYPSFHHDQVLDIIARNEFNSKNPLIQRIAKRFNRWNIDKLVDELVQDGLGQDYANLLAAYVSAQADITIIEGYCFKYDTIMEAFSAALKKQGFDVWSSMRT